MGRCMLHSFTHTHEHARARVEIYIKTHQKPMLQLKFQYMCKCAFVKAGFSAFSFARGSVQCVGNLHAQVL
jgi:hypothetical protein